MPGNSHDFIHSVLDDEDADSIEDENNHALEMKQNKIIGDEGSKAKNSVIKNSKALYDCN